MSSSATSPSRSISAARMRRCSFQAARPRPLTSPCARAAELQPRIELVAQEIGQHRVAAAAGDPNVEVVVEVVLHIGAVGIALQVAAVLLDHVGQPVEFVRPHLRRGEPAGHAFQRLAHVQQREEILQRRRDHPHALMGDMGDQPLLLKAPQGLAYRRAAHAEFLGEHQLVQLVAGLYAPGHDADRERLEQRVGLVRAPSGLR